MTLRRFQIKNTTFRLDQQEDGTLDLSSTHPYDETDYHWARLIVAPSFTGNGWGVYRNGLFVKSFGFLSAEEMALELLNLDEKEHLTPRPAIW